METREGDSRFHDSTVRWYDFKTQTDTVTLKYRKLNKGQDLSPLKLSQSEDSFLVQKGQVCNENKSSLKTSTKWGENSKGSNGTAIFTKRFHDIDAQFLHKKSDSLVRSSEMNTHALRYK